jgi:hypothetical protein
MNLIGADRLDLFGLVEYVRTTKQIQIFSRDLRCTLDEVQAEAGNVQ